MFEFIHSNKYQNFNKLADFGYYVEALWFYYSNIICLSSLSNFSVPDEDYSINVRVHYIWYLRLYYYHCVDTSADGLLVTDGVILPVGSASVLTLFIGYTYYWNLQFLNNVIIN